MSVEIIRDALCITVRNEGEYGAFFVREGKRGKGADTRHYCELTIQSSFGNVGHFWSHMDSPACVFLEQASKDYVLGKLFGKDAYVFDADRTELELRRLLLEDRRRGEFTKEQARDIHDALRGLSLFETLERFCDAYREYKDLLQWRTDDDIPLCNTLNPQAVGLWEKLWPQFIQALNEEALRPRDIVP